MVNDVPEDEWAVDWTPSKVVTFCAACLFLALCAGLPLVGPAGRQTDHFWPQNVLTFLGLLLAGGLLSLWGWQLAVKECKNGRTVSRLPSWALLLAHLLFLLIFLFGGFQSGVPGGFHI